MEKYLLAPGRTRKDSPLLSRTTGQSIGAAGKLVAEKIPSNQPCNNTVTP